MRQALLAPRYITVWIADTNAYGRAPGSGARELNESPNGGASAAASWVCRTRRSVWNGARAGRHLAWHRLEELFAHRLAAALWQHVVSTFLQAEPAKRYAQERPCSWSAVGKPFHIAGDERLRDPIGEGTFRSIPAE